MMDFQRTMNWKREREQRVEILSSDVLLLIHFFKSD